jgi:membrane protein implicated in regulation of membrane protease activity
MEAFLHVLAMLATGAVILFVSFMALAEISPTEVAGLSALALAVVVMLFVRARRIEREVRSRSGSPDLRDAANRQRERRGF